MIRAMAAGTLSVLAWALGALALVVVPALVLAPMGAARADQGTRLALAGGSADRSTSQAQSHSDRDAAVRRLTAKGTADSLAAAAVLAQFGEETDSGGYALVSRAVGLAPERADLAWLAVRMCNRATECDSAAPEEHLRKVDPNNAVAWMGALARAQAKYDVAAVDAALTAIAASERFYVYFNPLVAATAPELASARHRGSGQPSVQELTRATTEMMGVFAASLMPPSTSFSFSCKGLVLQQSAGRLERCQRAAQAFERADAYLIEGIGLSLQQRLWPTESAEGRAVTGRRRVFQYRLEQYSRLDMSSSKVDEIPADLLDMLRTHPREQDAALAYFAKAGIPTEPPADWTPTQLPRVP